MDISLVKRGTHQLVWCTTLNCMQYIFQDTIYSREFHTSSSFVTLSKAFSSIEHIEMNKKQKVSVGPWTNGSWITNLRNKIGLIFPSKLMSIHFHQMYKWYEWSWWTYMLTAAESSVCAIAQWNSCFIKANWTIQTGICSAFMIN